MHRDDVTLLDILNAARLALDNELWDVTQNAIPELIRYIEPLKREE